MHRTLFRSLAVIVALLMSTSLAHARSPQKRASHRKIAPDQVQKLVTKALTADQRKVLKKERCFARTQTAAARKACADADLPGPITGKLHASFRGPIGPYKDAVVFFTHRHDTRHVSVWVAGKTKKGSWKLHKALVLEDDEINTIDAVFFEDVHRDGLVDIFASYRFWPGAGKNAARDHAAGLALAWDKTKKRFASRQKWVPEIYRLDEPLLAREIRAHLRRNKLLSAKAQQGK